MEDEKFKLLLEAAPEPILIVDAKGKIALLNSQAEACFGYQREELIGQFVEVLIPSEFADQHRKLRQGYMKNPVKRPMGTDLNIIAKRKDGSIFPVDISLSPLKDEKGMILTVIIHDITHHKQLEAKLKYQAEHDSLTGLVNRNLLVDRIDQAITQAKRHHWMLAIFFIDIDNFKAINDKYGHATGDSVISAVARRIQESIRTMDTLARVGGDEFVLMVLEVKSETSVVKVAEKILRRFSEDFYIDDKTITVTISMGIALYPIDGHYSISLIDNADAAMYKAKNYGKNNFKFYASMP